MALAVLFGYGLAKKRAVKFGIDSKQADDVIFYLILGGFAGSRFYHVLTSLSFYQDHPAQIFYVWHGGLSIYGAVFGGILGLYLYSKLSIINSKLLILLNWLTPSLIVGQIIGRFGNFFNYELYGYPTNLPWKMFVPEKFRSMEFMSFEFFHPIFLYEQIGNLILLLVLFKLEKFQTRDRNAYLFLHYILWYNLLRFGLEFLRIDSPMLNGFRVNAGLSLSLTLFAFVILFIKCRKHTS